MDPVEILKLYRTSPVAFIKDMWGIVPLEEGEVFEKGKHIAPDQLEMLLAVEKALAGKAPPRISARSGHGIGKSSFMAWLILWYLFSFYQAQVPCTAPTGEQMYDVLWKEISKWHQLMPEDIKKLFEVTANHVRIKESPETWFARARTARKENPEALAGMHGEHVMFIVDEASGIPEAIFTTAEGALTGPNVLVIMCSNPTRLVGYFHDSHHSDKKDWQCFHFNSEESPLVTDKYVKRMEQKYGKDSDEYAIRVLGNFPQADSVDDKGYVPLILEDDLREVGNTGFTGGVKMGIDPAGEGSNKTVWVIRDNFKAKVVATEDVSNPVSIAAKTLVLADMFKVKQHDIYVDAFGVGADTVAELIKARCYVNSVQVGHTPKLESDAELYLNNRAMCYWHLKNWLRQGGDLVYNKGWKELLFMRYTRQMRGKIQMMSKHLMKKEGYDSPDHADALSLTFLDGATIRTPLTQHPDFPEEESQRVPMTVDDEEGGEFDII